MTHLVEIDSLTKKFPGGVLAVYNLSFNVEEGEVLGFIGPNGAGKSTTLKILATILKPTAGDARVAGYSVSRQPDVVRRLIGYMPDVCGLYDDMLVVDYLRFFASVYGIKHAAAEKSVADVLTLTGLAGKAGGTCGTLSRGMSQRLHLARVLLHDPKLLLLDEPAAGLDPRARIEFRDLVLTLKKMGKTLIISSHILSELGEMCDSICVIEKSKLVYAGKVEGATDKVSEQGVVYRILIDEELDQGRARIDLAETVRALPAVDAVRDGDRPGQILVRFKPEFRDFASINRELIERKWKVHEFAEERVRLEDAFLHLTKGMTQ